MSAKPIYEFDRTTTSTDAVPAALQGSIYWYDTETLENSEAVYYEPTDTYALWNHGTGWIVTVGADVGSLVADVFLSYPADVVVSGSAQGPFNGTYSFTAIADGRPKFVHDSSSDYQILYVDAETRWEHQFLGLTAYYIEGFEYLPPKSGWVLGNVSGAIPTYAYTDPSTPLVGVGSWSGTLTLSENTISEAWNKAERAVFTSLISFLGCTERVNAFRGRFELNKDGELKYRNVWMISSGGEAEAYDSERTYGENGNWCNLFIKSEIEGYFDSRVKAMNFASSVLAWLRSTDNLKTVSGSNVNWCMLDGLPETPEPTVGVAQVMWTVKIPLQILYLTEGEY